MQRTFESIHLEPIAHTPAITAAAGICCNRYMPGTAAHGVTGNLRRHQAFERMQSGKSNGYLPGQAPATKWLTPSDCWPANY